MIEIVLVRHGEPDWEPGGRAVDDPPLTERGRTQAAETARLLAGREFDSYYTSHLRRAGETARAIGAAIGIEPEVQTWLAELGLPKLEGKTSAEVRQFFSQVITRDLDRWWDGVPGGESFRHFYERVSSGIEGLLVGDHRLRIHQESPHRLWRIPDEDKRILIAAHEGTNGVILSHLLGMEPVPWAWMRFSSDHCGISRVQTARVASGYVWVLKFFNRQHQLSETSS